MVRFYPGAYCAHCGEPRPDVAVDATRCPECNYPLRRVTHHGKTRKRLREMMGV
jgi:uncharacterized protein with PIN domain